jgi:hypothetical protein
MLSLSKILLILLMPMGMETTDIDQKIGEYEDTIKEQFGLAVRAESIDRKFRLSTDITPSKKKYLKFLRVFYEEAKTQKLNAWGYDLSLTVSRENWNLGYLRPINTSGDFCQDDFHSFSTGASRISAKKSVRKLVEILALRKAYPDLFGDQVSLGSLRIQRGENYGGCVTLVSDQDFLHFVKDLKMVIDALPEQDKNCVLESAIDIKVIKLHLGQKLKRNDDGSFEVFQRAAGDLVSEILQLCG